MTAVTRFIAPTMNKKNLGIIMWGKDLPRSVAGSQCSLSLLTEWAPTLFIYLGMSQEKHLIDSWSENYCATNHNKHNKREGLIPTTIRGRGYLPTMMRCPNSSSRFKKPKSRERLPFPSPLPLPLPIDSALIWSIIILIDASASATCIIHRGQLRVAYLVEEEGRETFSYTSFTHK